MSERARRLKESVKLKMGIRLPRPPRMPAELLRFLDTMSSCILEAVADELDRELDGCPTCAGPLPPDRAGEVCAGCLRDIEDAHDLAEGAGCG